MKTKRITKSQRGCLKFVLALMLALLVADKQAGAQTPDWLWAKSAGGTDRDEGWGIATDANGNVFV